MSRSVGLLNPRPKGRLAEGHCLLQPTHPTHSFGLGVLMGHPHVLGSAEAAQGREALPSWNFLSIGLISQATGEIISYCTSTVRKVKLGNRPKSEAEGRGLT